MWVCASKTQHVISPLVCVAPVLVEGKGGGERWGRGRDGSIDRGIQAIKYIHKKIKNTKLP
jgi:hypothetical protein